jgi:penicillin amidase
VNGEPYCKRARLAYPGVILSGKMAFLFNARGSDMATRWKRRVAFGSAALVAVVVLILLAGWLFLRASLAQLDGTRRVAALAQPVTIVRDALGAPTVTGANRLDVAWATGFVHGQERFFQMDLLRRVAAGELAELFGVRALPTDRANRLHRFRARAQVALSRMTPAEVAFIDRYVAGVNHGLDALGARPFEYGVITSTPRPWSRADCMLVVYAMFLDLQGRQIPRELSRGWLRSHTDAAQRAFLLPEITPWDVPLDADVPSTLPEAPIPPAAPLWWGRQRVELTRLSQMADPQLPDMVGSNSWAIAGRRSTTGAAIVEDDMHLGLQLPNIWYRMALRFPDPNGRQRRLVGVTLPGAPPMIIAGSNGDVAWGFTNSYADLLDLVVLAQDAAHAQQLRTPAGWETPVEHVERIRVKDRPDDVLTVRETAFGPVRVVGGVSYAVHWIAHDPAALNMHHWQMEGVRDVDAALNVAARDGIPGQNLIAGDALGNIGWTIAGILPQRAGSGDASLPVTPDSTVGTWTALLPPGAYPRSVNPASLQLVTSNSRQLQGPHAALLGDGGFDLGARQRQLHDRLLALGPRATVRQVQAVALDDRALFMAPWRARALKVLDAQAVAGRPRRAELRRLLAERWDGRASAHAVAYRIARGFQSALYALLFDGANGAMAAIDPKAGIATATSRWPVVVARLLDAEPAGWLPPAYPDWRALQLAALDRVIDTLGNEGRSLALATWGERNTAAIAHPLAGALPFLGRFLAAPPDRLAGDADMPRVAGPAFGQSERMTVSPGHEEQGLFNMPGGQSGHPLSPFFLAGHDDWVHERPLPLLPGPAQHTLTLQP